MAEWEEVLWAEGPPGSKPLPQPRGLLNKLGSEASLRRPLCSSGAKETDEHKAHAEARSAERQVRPQGASGQPRG